MNTSSGHTKIEPYLDNRTLASAAIQRVRQSAVFASNDLQQFCLTLAFGGCAADRSDGCNGEECQQRRAKSEGSCNDTDNAGDHAGDCDPGVGTASDLHRTSDLFINSSPVLRFRRGGSAHRGEAMSPLLVAA